MNNSQGLYQSDKMEPVDQPPFGTFSVYKNGEGLEPALIEGDLPEEVAHQIVADYAAEGETVWMERTPAE